MIDRNSYDDLETDYLEEETESGFLSLMSVVIAFVAVAVFIALAWYAYQTGTDVVPMEDIEIVYPEEGAIRETPEDPGGWQFPDQDRSVYNIISGENQDIKVEKILPAPEQPVERPDMQTQTWMNDNLNNKKIAKTDAERQMETLKKQEPQPAPAAAAPEKPAEPVSAAAPAVAKAEPVVEEVKMEPEPAEAKAPKAQEKPAAVVSLTRTRLQLGAVRSEQEARDSWNKLTKKFPQLVGGKSLHIERADIPDKGTYYRIQLYPFADKAEADALCKQLDAQGQACFAIVK